MSGAGGGARGDGLPGAGDRQRREQAFHDRWAEEVDPGELDPVRMATCPTTPETRFALAAIGAAGPPGEPGALAGQRVLDLGCGYGETAAWLAMQGATVDAVDISPRMLEVSRRLAERAGVAGRIRFHAAPGEALPFPEAAFDAAFGHDVLHHLDLDRARREILRVVRPGGRAVFAEPLGHNPILNRFRDLSPETRTPDEVPLRFADFGRLADGFRSMRHREFHLLTMSLFLWFYVVERADPNRERYWKKIIVESDRYRRPFSVLNALDRAALALCPPLGRLCRMTVIVLER